MKSYETVSHKWVVIDGLSGRAIHCPYLGSRYIWHLTKTNTIAILIFHRFRLPIIAFRLPLRQEISTPKLLAVYYKVFTQQHILPS